MVYLGYIVMRKLLENYNQHENVEAFMKGLRRLQCKDITYQLYHLVMSNEPVMHDLLLHGKAGGLFGLVCGHLLEFQHLEANHIYRFLAALSGTKIGNLSDAACKSVSSLFMRLKNSKRHEAKPIVQSLRLIVLIISNNPRIKRFLNPKIYSVLEQKLSKMDLRAIDVSQTFGAIAQAHTHQYESLAALKPKKVASLFKNFLSDRHNAVLQDHSRFVWALMRYANTQDDNFTDISRKRFRRFFKAAARSAKKTSHSDSKAPVSISMLLWGASQVTQVKAWGKRRAGKKKRLIKTRDLVRLAKACNQFGARRLEQLPEENRHQLNQAGRFFNKRLRSHGMEVPFFKIESPRAAIMTGVHSNVRDFLWRQGIKCIIETRLEGLYDVDLFIPGKGSKGIVIEVDGPSHQEKPWKDRIKTKSLQKLGYKVVRISHEEIKRVSKTSMSSLKDIFEAQLPELFPSCGAVTGSGLTP